MLGGVGLFKISSLFAGAGPFKAARLLEGGCPYERSYTPLQPFKELSRVFEGEGDGEGNCPSSAFCQLPS